MIHNYLLLMAALLLSGCSTLSWYGQAVQGQYEIWELQKPIGSLLDDPLTPDQLAKRLRTANEIRLFAVMEMQLPDNDSYTSFADLQRDSVLWAVFAADQDSIELKQWCYPLVGCVGYRGFFAEEDAAKLTTKLRQQGLDVYISPVPAYSTLGWFTDPLLNTFINWPTPYLAELILHELAHQQLYIEDDSRFNESFATAVAEEGVRRWLEKNHAAPSTLKGYEQAVQSNRQIIALALKTRGQLEVLYASQLTLDEKMRQKKIYLESLFTQISSLNGLSDHMASSWRYEKLNNARLGAIATYYDLVPAFKKLIEQSHGDMQLFYQQAKRIGRLSLSERQQALVELLE
ncbi:MAG: aminopeptidase [Gammaproteobacteria bacterium]|nr:MAG: aminopeptidase [Gammaproteobacteria bacterium]